MYFLEACLEKYYIIFLMFMFLLGTVYLYYENKKNEKD
jgi:hypothetical protein